MLKQIMRRRRKPLFLVIDSLPAHKAKLVRDYVETTNGKLKLYFLPGYAPELNPDELGTEPHETHRYCEASARLKRIAAGTHRGRPYQYPEQSRSRPLLL